jgi:hypothetical protein
LYTALFDSPDVVKENVKLLIISIFVKEAIEVAEGGFLVTMGITLTYPCTGYGYIRFDK